MFGVKKSANTDKTGVRHNKIGFGALKNKSPNVLINGENSLTLSRFSKDVLTVDFGVVAEPDCIRKVL